jgi:Cu/Ag efflux protein CusF
MTMEFDVRDPAILEGLKPGQQVEFDLVKEGGDFPVTAIRPAPDKPGAHAGH